MIAQSFGMEVIEMGTTPYLKALEVQNDLLEKRIDGEIPDTLLVLEHAPVVTLGRLAGEESALDRSYFQRNEIPVVRTVRGGRNTYHAPGQLVLYPMIDLGRKRKNIALYIDFLERTVAASLEALGVPAEENLERRGVWVGGKKIAFIGIAVKKWVTYHGISININNGLEPFRRMHPCGESDICVTSASEVLGRTLDMSDVRKIFIEQFLSSFEKEYTLEETARDY